jgi:RNA polymerase sigma factor (TIGR02999 family)
MILGCFFLDNVMCARLNEPMNVEAAGLIEVLISRAAEGDRGAYDQVFAIAYQDLHRLAHQVRGKVAGGALNTTGLVHECYLRLLKAPPKADGQAHFLAIMATAMRHLLIEHARAVATCKRGSGQSHLDLNELDEAVLDNADELIHVDQLLQKLALHSSQQVAIVECRFFAGFSDPETADALRIPLRTVQREWARVRDWMLEQSNSVH